MTNKKTFLQTATLIEDILGVKKVSLKCIERIKNICLIYKNKSLTVKSDKHVEYVTSNIWWCLIMVRNRKWFSWSGSRTCRDWSRALTSSSSPTSVVSSPSPYLSLMWGTMTNTHSWLKTHSRNAIPAPHVLRSTRVCGLLTWLYLELMPQRAVKWWLRIRSLLKGNLLYGKITAFSIQYTVYIEYFWQEKFYGVSVNRVWIIKT